MILVTEFEIPSGRLILIRGFPDEATLDLNRQNGFDFIEGEHDPALFFVKEGVITERPLMDLTTDQSSIKADGLDILRVSGFPMGMTTCRLIGPVCEEWDESLDHTAFTVNVPGSYRLMISQFPFKNEEITFNAA